VSISSKRLVPAALASLLLSWALLSLVVPHVAGVTGGEAALTWGLVFGCYLTAEAVTAALRRSGPRSKR
jgi:hypothetical protein